MDALTLGVLCAIAFAGGLWVAILWAWDVWFQKLPNILTIPAAGAAILLAVALQPPAVVGALMWAGLYASIRTIVGVRGIGGGDVKLAVTLGVVAAWPGVGWVIVAMFLAQVATIGWWLWRPRRYVAHGPCMMVGVAGAWVLAM